MTVRIPKSLIAKLGIQDLPKAVADHQAELATWQAHMDRVEADAKLPPIPRPTFAQFAGGPTAVADFKKALNVYSSNVATRHQPYPAPDPHPLVLQALNGFEIFDDSPSPEQVLADKKAALMAKVSAAEAAVSAAIAPIGKRRINNMRETAIRATDATVSQAAVAAKWKNLISAGAALGLVDRAKAMDVSKSVEDARPADDTKFLADQQARSARMSAIAAICAKAYSDIEDLTLANVDQWQMPDLTVAK